MGIRVEPRANKFKSRGYRGWAKQATSKRADGVREGGYVSPCVVLTDGGVRGGIERIGKRVVSEKEEKKPEPEVKEFDWGKAEYIKEESKGEKLKKGRKKGKKKEEGKDLV